MMGFDIANYKAFALWQQAFHLTPGIDQHAVAPGRTAVFMAATLRRRQHITLVFNRPGAQQDFPVRLAGCISKCRRHHDQRAIAHRAV
ncbi:hypothetical protein D3C74_478410 [compost metagenome]